MTQAVAHLLDKIKQLSPSEQLELRRAIVERVELAADEPEAAVPVTDKTPRWGLHPGAWEVADDFDALLPEEFWLGQDA